MSNGAFVQALARIIAWNFAMVAERRQALRQILGTPFRFEPDGKRYRFSAEDTRGQLIGGFSCRTFYGVPDRPKLEPDRRLPRIDANVAGCIGAGGMTTHRFPIAHDVSGLSLWRLEPDFRPLF